MYDSVYSNFAKLFHSKHVDSLEQVAIQNESGTFSN